MAGKKRRTEIQIETHEITIIRFGKTHPLGSLDNLLEEADVIGHGNADPGETAATKEKEKRNDDQN